jgi:hypothetical protein
MRWPIAITLCLVGCGMAPREPPQEQSPYVAGFTPPPVQDGYTRYVTPVIAAIPPGADVTQCQWLAAPSDRDLDIVSILGEQSRGGHHIVMYATKVIEAVGTSRDCTAEDNVSINFLGAIGGEGNSTTGGKIPDGVVFRLPKGQALMANTHFINASQEPFDGQGVVDLRTAPASPTAQVANLFANVGIGFSVPVGQSATYDTSCVFQRDLAFFDVANHMHQYGRKVSSELIHADGTREPLVADDPWPAEQMFNFRFASWPLARPKEIHAGDTLHTQCTWNNTAGKTLRFPDEMCVMFGFFLETGGVGAQTVCTDGHWSDG